MERIFQILNRENPRKCGIVGCGRVGATIAFTLMQTSWFSEMVLIDSDTGKAEGNAADLTHGLPFHRPMDIYAGDYSDLIDCGIIVLAAGAAQHPNQTRTDLFETNGRVFSDIVTKISRYNESAILLVVSNPVDILTKLTLELSGFPRSRVIGSGTVLDTARLKQLVGSYLGVNSKNVHSFIIGEHGDSEFPVWSSANISGVDLSHYGESAGRGYDRSLLDGLFREVRDSAYQIIRQKGATCYAIAESVKAILSAILFDENAILTVSTAVEGEYGIEGVALSLPCIVGKSGIKRVLEIPLDSDEESRLFASANYLADKMI